MFEMAPVVHPDKSHPGLLMAVALHSAFHIVPDSDLQAQREDHQRLPSEEQRTLESQI